MLSWVRSRALAASEALELALVHARRAGDRALVEDLRGHGAAPMMIGPAPPQAMRAWIDATEAEGGGPMVRYGLDLVRGSLARMEYRLDDAMAHYTANQALLAELGFELLASAGSQLTSRVALSAGDVDEAVRLLRAGCDEGRRLGDRSYHSTTLAYLAEAVRRQGGLDEAERLALEAEAVSAAEDVVNFAITRATRALVAAARGELETALTLAGEAVEHAELTDLTVSIAQAHLAHGAVLRAAGREPEADAAFALAIALADAKGDEPEADRARTVAAGTPG